MVNLEKIVPVHLGWGLCGGENMGYIQYGIKIPKLDPTKAKPLGQPVYINKKSHPQDMLDDIKENLSAYLKIAAISEDKLTELVLE